MGQGAGAIRDVKSACEIVSDILAEAERVLRRLELLRS
jgi:hypothetical protein